MGTEHLAFSTVGAGRKVTVLLHGFLGSGKNLRSLAVRWGQADPDRIFVLPDLRGHGDSPALLPGTMARDLAQDVMACVDVAAPGAVVDVVGHSFGGRVALATTGVAPERLKEVVMLDIAPGPIDLSESRGVLDTLLRAPDECVSRAEMKQHLVGEGLSAGLSDWVLMNLKPKDGDGGGLVWRFDRAALDRLHASFTREDLWPLAHNADVPLRMIYGGRSAYVSRADVARFEALGGHVDALPHAGHFVHVDALTELVGLLA